ncbi:TMEM245 [Cordylochernes scorpioides]|uniref:TMEM245 n=1 Tax=Cordylochernes scorpioides TaxID=51811 RepID=A0ABY6KKX3_9ARAC|nr:TMEM245 [Cordylochernes scorpioides]
MLEKQILDLWDRVYHQWVSGNMTKMHRLTDVHHGGPLQRQQSASFDSLVDGFKTLNLELIATFIQENIGILMTVTAGISFPPHLICQSI